MSDGTKYIPRISFEVTHEFRERLQRCIPWGTMKPLITAILEDLIQFIEETGIENRNIIIGAILSDKISMVEIMKKTERPE